VAPPTLQELTSQFNFEDRLRPSRRQTNGTALNFGPRGPNLLRAHNSDSFAPQSRDGSEEGTSGFGNLVRKYRVKVPHPAMHCIFGSLGRVFEDLLDKHAKANSSGVLGNNGPSEFSYLLD
jgi:hypothetical protein